MKNKSITSGSVLVFKGDYHAEVTLTDSATNNVILCLTIDLSVDKPSSGGFLFVKK